MRRRRTRRSFSTRVRTYWVLGVLVLACLAGGIWWLVTAPLFAMRTPQIAGLVRVPMSDVFARAALAPKTNIWLIDGGAVARRIETIPYVASAWVGRRLPDHVRIVVTERIPTACVRDAVHRVFTIDDALRVLQRGCAAATGALYVVHAPLPVTPGTFLHVVELARLQNDAGALAAAGKHYRSFTDEAGDLVAILADGMTVRFGADADLVREQALIAPILAALGSRAADVRSIDLRAPTTPVVEYRPTPRAVSTTRSPQQ